MTDAPTSPIQVSVVIPTLNEKGSIRGAIQSAFAAGANEVIVSDGGSSDDTLGQAQAAGAQKIVRSLPGRGIQLNSGAFVADSDWLLFLHADNRLGPASIDQLAQAASRGAIWGGFRQSIESDRLVLKVIQWGNGLRIRYRRLPFGDQAIFVRRDHFKEQGGFAEIPLMEDVEFSKRMRKHSRPELLEGPVTVDARRWEKRGVIRQTLLNWSIQLRYGLGESPESLRKRYR